MGYIVCELDLIWPGGIIPFTISETDFPDGSSSRETIVNAISDWNLSNTGTLLRERVSDDDHGVEFRTGTACSSHVGRDSNVATQSISCDLTRFGKGSVIHEIGHAAGLYHEHQRPMLPGKQAYILRLVDENIDPDWRTNVITRWRGWEFGPVDFNSIMCYSRTGGGKTDDSGNRLTTLIPFDGGEYGTGDDLNIAIGQRAALSAGDIETLRMIYSRHISYGQAGYRIEYDSELDREGVRSYRVTVGTVLYWAWVPNRYGTDQRTLPVRLPATVELATKKV